VTSRTDLEGFFEGFEPSRTLFDVLRMAMDRLPVVSMAVSKSQIAFRRRRAFAWAWIPDRYLDGEHAPLVLSLAFRYRDASGRWKQVFEATPGRFMHHLELPSPDEVDEEVISWIWEAWAEAG
jgi:hypothetical protein